MPGPGPEARERRRAEGPRLPPSSEELRGPGAGSYVAISLVTMNCPTTAVSIAM
jgi:hypothetical protein